MLAEDVQVLLIELWAGLCAVDEDDNVSSADSHSLSVISRLAEDYAHHGVLLVSLFGCITNPDAFRQAVQDNQGSERPSFAEEGQLQLGSGLKIDLTTCWGYDNSLRSLNSLLSFDLTFLNHLTVRGLRNWLSLMNATVIIAQGSESQLRFRYSLFPPLAVIFSGLPSIFPEFLGKMYDYVDQWQKRLVYDSHTIELLYNCCRGELGCVVECVRHMCSQISGSYLQLRSEATNETDKVLPAYLVNLIKKWDQQEPVGGGSPTAQTQAVKWYKETVGASSATKIAALQEDINTKFATILKKYQLSSDEEILRTKPQTLVIIRRELEQRIALLLEEIRLCTLLDAHHAHLVSRLNHFSTLLHQLEAAEDI